MKLTKLVIVISLVSVVTVCLGAAVVWSQASSRSDLRMFYTAPPVIPHEVMAQDGSACLMCHEGLAELGNRVSVPTPHPEFTNCLQCHVPVTPPNGMHVPDSLNEWKGLEEPVEGDLVSEVAPPTIPHRLFLRENCLTCHHPDHPDESLRSPHPERSNCQQCHVADPANEFVHGN